MQDVTTEVQGQVGLITLNRPKALNALNTAMCKAITEALRSWEDNPNIGAVVVRGAGGRAFCAGGDVVMLHESGLGDGKDAEEFWRIEYALNELIHRYRKPYISMIDGIVMGGGVGLSIHGRHRIAGDETLFAMPETGIGYFPDVGGTYFLPRLGQAEAMWLGLTGARLKTAAVCEMGIATAYIPSANHQNFIQALTKAPLDGTDASVLDIMMRFVEKPDPAENLPSSLQVFGAGSVVEIMDKLARDDSEWAKKQHSIMLKKSPLAMAVTFRALLEGGKLSFRDAMSQELNLSLNFLKSKDFYEGIRAQLIDKDRNPAWSSATVQDVTTTEVAKFFEKVASPELEFWT